MSGEGHDVLTCLKVLDASRSGFYEWRTRPPSARSVRRAWLTDLITHVHADSNGTYGAPRGHAELRLAHGIVVGHNTVGRLMRQAGLRGLPAFHRPRWKHREPTAADLVERSFARSEPDRLWVTDITEHPTRRMPAVVATPRPWRCAMGISKQQRATWPIRGKIYSPGRPPVWQREQVQRFWMKIAEGLSSEDAAIAVGVSSPVGSRWFREAGGMRPISLTPRSSRYLSFNEREEIAILNAQGFGVREIARQVRKSPSTISRELRRNAATRSGLSGYRAVNAQWHADRRARRPKTAKLVANNRLREYVEDRLSGLIARPDGTAVEGPAVRFIGRRHGRRQDRRWGKAWSPEQISNRLRVDFPDDETMRISTEAIYQSLFIQGRGALKRDLVACLRTGRALRVPRARTAGRGKKFVTKEVMISERPPEVEDRAVPGHWEGDLIIGLNKSAIGTLVERTTRFTMLLHLPPMEGHGTIAPVKNGPPLAGHGAEAVRDAIAASFATLPEQLRRSLTWDQGAEMAQHTKLKIDTGLAIYFCDPHSPWQRGTNENTNGLLRQYFPKGTDLHRYPPEDLAAVAAALNGRPRKTLAWKTPAEALDFLLQSDGPAGVATTVGA